MTITLDKTFGGNGIVTTDFFSNYENVSAINDTFENNNLVRTANIDYSPVTYIIGCPLSNNIVGTVNRDVIGGSAGNDTILGLSGNDTLIGDEDNDNLNGGAGNDSLIGEIGNDTLTGGLGADKFTYNTQAIFTKTAVGLDTITDFVIAQGDKIVLDKTTFPKITSTIGTGFSQKSEFAKVTTNTAAATSAADIVYNSATGGLFYNQNGTATGFGTGGQFLTLTNKPVLTENQFIIQA